jgi:hypothetical protein
MGRTITRLAAACILAAGVPLGLVSTTAAHAAPAPTPKACAQGKCDGLDPTLSYLQGTNPKQFCSDGATSPLIGTVLGGTLELRWGHNCQTNWTRFTPGNNDTYQIWVVNLTNGHWAGTGLYNRYQFSGANGVAHYSDQVYSPGPARADVYDVTTGQLACLTQGQTHIC